MPSTRVLSPAFSVAPQLTVDDVAAAARAGFGTIVNNRPDGEQPDAAQGDAIRAAAEAAGLSYHAIPVGGAGIAGPQIAATARAIDAAEADGRPVLAYCRSGTRSATLWAMTRASRGDDPDALLAAAAGAGYDLSGRDLVLRALAAAAADGGSAA